MLTMKEKLRIHAEIKEANRRHLADWKAAMSKPEPTVDEVMTALIDFMDGKIEEWPWPEAISEDERKHGPVVKTYWTAYHNVTVYADGYEEMDYIGD